MVKFNGLSACQSKWNLTFEAGYRIETPRELRSSASLARGTFFASNAASVSAQSDRTVHLMPKRFITRRNWNDSVRASPRLQLSCNAFAALRRPSSGRCGSSTASLVAHHTVVRGQLKPTQMNLVPLCKFPDLAPRPFRICLLPLDRSVIAEHTDTQF